MITMTLWPPSAGGVVVLLLVVGVVGVALVDGGVGLGLHLL
jgi:hypothetical protein